MLSRFFWTQQIHSTPLCVSGVDLRVWNAIGVICADLLFAVLLTQLGDENGELGEGDVVGGGAAGAVARTVNQLIHWKKKTCTEALELSVLSSATNVQIIALCNIEIY